MISRLDFRYPSQFGENGTLRAVKETDDNQPANNDQEPIIPDRTVNYRKCILPFVLGVALMLAGIIMLPIGMVLRNKYDIFSFLGAICILFALMFMAFWYTCSLEVQDREMPKIQLPERSKVPPKWLQNTNSRTPSKQVQSQMATPDCSRNGCFPSRPKSENLLATQAVVELSEISTPTSSSHNLDFRHSQEGEVNPSFQGHEDTPC